MTLMGDAAARNDEEHQQVRAAMVGCGPVTPNVEALQRQLAQARDHGQELATENAHLRSKIRTLSAVITELTHETSGANVVVPMPRKRPGR